MYVDAPRQGRYQIKRPNGLFLFNLYFFIRYDAICQPLGF